MGFAWHSADEIVSGRCDQVAVLSLSIFAPRAGVWMSSFLYIERGGNLV